MLFRSVDVREFFRSYAMRMFAEKPVFGHGAGAFKSTMRLIKYTLVAYSHCNYTELLANEGIFGFVLYYSLSVFVLLKGVKAYKYKKKDKSQMAVLISILMAFVFTDYYAVTYDSIFVQTVVGLLFLLLVCPQEDHIVERQRYRNEGIVYWNRVF